MLHNDNWKTVKTSLKTNSTNNKSIDNLKENQKKKTIKRKKTLKQSNNKKQLLDSSKPEENSENSDMSFCNNTDDEATSRLPPNWNLGYSQSILGANWKKVAGKLMTMILPDLLQAKAHKPTNTKIQCSDVELFHIVQKYFMKNQVEHI